MIDYIVDQCCVMLYSITQLVASRQQLPLRQAKCIYMFTLRVIIIKLMKND